MPLKPLSRQEVLARGTRIMRAGLEGGKIASAYGKSVLDMSVHLTAEAANWAAQNPIPAACICVGATGATTLVAPSLATAPALLALGFTPSGIQAGSAAAAAHSCVGKIVAGSALAIGQSAGAGGNGLLIVNGIAQAGGAAVSVGCARLGWIKARL